MTKLRLMQEVRVPGCGTCDGTGHIVLPCAAHEGRGGNDPGCSCPPEEVRCPECYPYEADEPAFEMRGSTRLNQLLAGMPVNIRNPDSTAAFEEELAALPPDLRARILRGRGRGGNEYRLAAAVAQEFAAEPPPVPQPPHNHEHNMNRCLGEDELGVERCCYDGSTPGEDARGRRVSRVFRVSTTMHAVLVRCGECLWCWATTREDLQASLARHFRECPSCTEPGAQKAAR